MNYQLKSNEQRAKITITLIWIVMFLETGSLISGFLQYKLLQTIASGGPIDLAEINANAIREQIIAISYMVVFIASAVAFIMWFRRAYRNLHSKVSNLSFAEGWAAGSWFVPILNLYRPYQIMKELFRETKKLLSGVPLTAPVNLSVSLVGLWWTVWIISGVLGQAVFKLSMKAETVDQLILTTVVDMLSSIVGIGLALITIKLIKNYSSVEPLLFKIKNTQEETKE